MKSFPAQLLLAMVVGSGAGLCQAQNVPLSGKRPVVPVKLGLPNLNDISNSEIDRLKIQPTHVVLADNRTDTTIVYSVDVDMPKASPVLPAVPKLADVPLDHWNGIITIPQAIQTKLNTPRATEPNRLTLVPITLAPNQNTPAGSILVRHRGADELPTVTLKRGEARPLQSNPAQPRTY